MINNLYLIDEFKGQYFWLSNMSPISSFIVDGITYYAVENFYQAQKTLSVGRRLTISRLNPYDSKQWGKAVTLRSDWDSVKDDVMKTALEYKFSQPKLFNKLINTGESELVHGNYHGDVYWGRCLRTGKGKNKLGEYIMQIRTRAFELMESFEYRIDLYNHIEMFLQQFDHKHMDPIAIKFLQNEFIKQFDDESLNIINQIINESDLDLDEVLNQVSRLKLNPQSIQYSLVVSHVIDFAVKYQEYLAKSNYEIQVK